jgi:hypothetical protein
MSFAMVFILRFFSDLLWSIKPVSIFANGVLLFLVLSMVIQNRISIDKSANFPLKILAILCLIFVQSFLNSINAATVIFLFKVLMSFHFYNVTHIRKMERRFHHI